MSWIVELHPRWAEWLIPMAIGLACFGVTELMHRLLVPDLGPRKERWLAEAVSAAIVGGLVAKLANVVHQRHQTMLARVQVISEMNHHIRNALMTIAASTELSQNQERMRVISESVNRIDWALREILPRKQPLPETERSRLMFVMSGGKRDLSKNHESKASRSISGKTGAS
ncbi:MAG: hypothetical protein WAL32_03440 [Terriglobales bacterium]